MPAQRSHRRSEIVPVLSRTGFRSVTASDFEAQVRRKAGTSFGRAPRTCSLAWVDGSGHPPRKGVKRTPGKSVRDSDIDRLYRPNNSPRDQPALQLRSNAEL